MIIEFFREFFQLVNERTFEKRRCPFCEELKQILNQERQEKRKLLDFIIDSEKEVPKELPKEIQPIQPKMIPWRIRREMLEAEDRKQAQLMRETEALEKELLKEEK